MTAFVIRTLYVISSQFQGDTAMTIIQDLMKTIEIGQSISFENLTLYPLLGEPGEKMDYITLDEALAAKKASVAEVSAAGSVPDLLFRNDGDTPVLLLDGEELIGAKQNRVLNLSILAPANETIIIPVSCVEAGRWSQLTPGFQSSGHSMYARGRAAKVSQVSMSMRTGHSHSNQSEIWRDISQKSDRMGVRSATNAMSDIYESRAEKLAEYLPQFEAVENQIGAMFEIDGAIAGMDLFDRETTLAKVLPKLVHSFALDAIEVFPDRGSEPSTERAGQFIGAVTATAIDSFPAAGLGEDLRLSDEMVSGGALAIDGIVVHLYAFPVQVELDSNDPNRYRSRVHR
jgi:hypothetical protein